MGFGASTGAKGTVPSGSISDLELASPVSGSYRLVHTQDGCYYGNGAAPSATPVILWANQQAAAGGTNVVGVTAFYLDPTVFAVSNKTTKFRLLCGVLVNSIAPGTSTSFKVGLHTAAPSNSTNVAVDITTAPVTGSQPSPLLEPAALSTQVLDSGDFTPPAAGLFVYGLILTGAAAAAASWATFIPRLLVRNV